METPNRHRGENRAFTPKEVRQKRNQNLCETTGRSPWPYIATSTSQRVRRKFTQVENSWLKLSCCSYPFRDLNVQHEEVHMFLPFVKLQRLGDDRHQHGCAGDTLQAKHTRGRRQSARMRCARLIHTSICRSAEETSAKRDRYNFESSDFGSITPHQGEHLFTKLNVDLWPAYGCIEESYIYGRRPLWHCYGAVFIALRCGWKLS